MKKWLTGLAGIFFINLVSAQFYPGGRFSIQELFYRIDPITVQFFAVFLIIFAAVFFSTSKIFLNRRTGEPNGGVAGVISLCIAFLASYGLFRSGFDLTYYWYRYGLGNWLWGIAAIFIIWLIIAFFSRRKRN